MAEIHEPVYLGDSVYARFDGYHVVLETRNGVPTDPSNTIALDSYVIAALQRYMQELGEKLETLK